MTKVEAKAALRGELKRHLTDEEVKEFMSSLTDVEFAEILAYAEACCDLRLAGKL